MKTYAAIKIEIGKIPTLNGKIPTTYYRIEKVKQLREQND